jgi:hypothetical protein
MGSVKVIMKWGWMGALFSCIRELIPFLRRYNPPASPAPPPPPVAWYTDLYHRLCRIASQVSPVNIFVLCFSMFHFILPCHLRLGLASGVYLSNFPIKTFHAVSIKIRYSALRIVIRVTGSIGSLNHGPCKIF